MQVLKPPPSSWHSKVEPVSVEAKRRSATVAAVVPAGPAVIVVSGGVESTVKAASVAKWVASDSRRSFQAPWLPAAKAGQPAS